MGSSDDSKTWLSIVRPPSLNIPNQSQVCVVKEHGCQSVDHCMTDHVVEIVEPNFFRLSAVVLRFCDIVWRLTTGAASRGSSESRNCSLGSNCVAISVRSCIC